MFIGKLQIEYINGYKWRLIPNNRFYFIYESGIIEPDYNFVSDGTSIPRILWWIEPPFGKASPAAVIHDWLINRGFNKQYVDNVFYEALIALKVKPYKAKLMYWGVKLLGRY